MAVSVEVAREHIRFWTEQLRRFPRLANWPAHLFHAADLSNAVEILRSGRLICRRDLPGIPCDVANQGALWNNPEAHNYVRLYFRPRTSFHLSTEGIKCTGDPYRRDPHMSIPVMFALDSSMLITTDGVGFSRGKLSRKRPVGFDDDFFGSIDFESVYHDGPLSQAADHEIQDRRMAEVVVPRVLPLQPYLRKVICRTSLERRTLLHHLGARAAEFGADVTVEQVAQSTFLHKAFYLTEVAFRDGELSLDFHPPTRLPESGEYQVDVELRREGRVVEGRQGAVPVSSSGVRIGGFQNPQGIWKIRLEGALAYEAPIPSEASIIR